MNNIFSRGLLVSTPDYRIYMDDNDPLGMAGMVSSFTVTIGMVGH